MILENNEAIFNTWFKIWLIAHAIKLTRQQKWFDIEQNVKKNGNYYSLSETDFEVSIQYDQGYQKKQRREL